MSQLQGYLKKQGGNIKTWKKRFFCIKDGTLYYSKIPGTPFLGSIDLTHSSIRVHQDPKRKFCFEIETEQRLFLLIAETLKEMDDWIAACKEEQERVNKSIHDGESAVVEDGKKDRVNIESFETLALVGQGSFGVVFQVKKKDTGKIYAMKVLNKKNIIEKNETEHTKAERNILQKLNHPFLVNLYYSFQTPEKLYFVMDYVNGGELFFHLQKCRRFDEPRAIFYCAEICCGVGYLHENGVLYRDLKPENLLLTREGHICMTDFGIAKEGLYSENDRTSTFCGTPEYLAPEVLIGSSYGNGVDWWSFGILMYEMLSGLPPFYSQDVNQMYTNIISASVQFPEYFSADAKTLLRQLLVRNPEDRLKDIKIIQSSQWFSTIDWEALIEKKITPPFIPPVTNDADLGMVDPEFTSVDFKSLSISGNSAEETQPNFEGFTYVADSGLN